MNLGRLLFELVTTVVSLWAAQQALKIFSIHVSLKPHRGVNVRDKDAPSTWTQPNMARRGGIVACPNPHRVLGGTGCQRDGPMRCHVLLSPALQSGPAS